MKADKTSKLVSVIIPTFKRSDILSRAIDSVLAQRYKNVEIIVVDDNSPETNERTLTENVMSRYNDVDKIIYIKHDANRNGSAARNTGFGASQGYYVMFLDDDDEFTGDKISKQVERLEYLGESWGACYSDYIRKKHKRTVMYSAEKREGNLLKEELMRNLFIHAGSNLMLRRKVVEELGGFDESFTRNQDIEFMVRLLLKYKLAYTNELGLIVHTRETKVNFGNFENITRDYLKKFDHTIKSLPRNDQVDIYKMIGLQLVRFQIFSNKNIRKAFQLMKDESIGMVLTMRYFLHLFRRKITKKAYGFKL